MHVNILHAKVLSTCMAAQTARLWALQTQWPRLASLGPQRWLAWYACLRRAGQVQPLELFHRCLGVWHRCWPAVFLYLSAVICQASDSAEASAHALPECHLWDLAAPVNLVCAVACDIRIKHSK